MADDMPLGALIIFEGADEDNHHIYQTPFADTPRNGS